MKLPVAREYHAILDDTMAPALAQAGFSHRKRPAGRLRDDDFVRRVAGTDLAHVISTQETQHASETHTAWTVIVAVYVPELRAIRGAHCDEEVPDAGACFASARIGELLRSDEDFWYELGDTLGRVALKKPLPQHPVHATYSPLRPASVRAALTRDLEDVVLPCLAPLTSREALYGRLMGPSAPRRAGVLDHLALELALGHFDAARAHLAALPDRPDLRAYARTRYGLEI